MSLASIKPNTYIFKEGGIGNYFLFIKGTMEVISKNNQKRILF